MHGSALEEARTATSVGRRVLQLGVYGLELLTALTPQRCVGVSQNTTLSNPLVKRVIPNGVDRTVFHPDAAERSDRPIIVFVGALTGRKRGAWLVREFVDHIKPHVPDAELHMVSHSGEAVPGVVFHTGLADSELAALYRRAWVYASPSTYEGFGLPYVEAMACGVPVVATPNPGSLEVLGGGQYGRVVDDAVFSETVVHLLRDQQVRTSLVRAGLARAADLRPRAHAG
jgi:glycosyltransferase involved in cell wall biosynthesis